MKHLLIMLFIIASALECCQYPDLTEVQIDKKEYSLEIIAAKNCNDAGGGGTEMEIKYNCYTIPRLLTDLLGRQLTQRYKAQTGLDKEFHIHEFQETGKRYPYMFDINLRFNEEKYTRQTLPYEEIISLLETHYNIKINYSPRDYSF